MDDSDSYSRSPSNSSRSPSVPSSVPSSAHSSTHSRSPTPSDEVTRQRINAADYMKQKEYSEINPPPFPEKMLKYINLEKGLRWQPGFHEQGTWILDDFTPPQILHHYIENNYYHNILINENIPTSWNEVYYYNYDDINNKGMLYDPDTYEFYHREDEGHSTDSYSSDQSDIGTGSEKSREPTPQLAFQGGSIRRSFNAIKKLNHQIQKKHK
jgi:hypothetical protein